DTGNFNYVAPGNVQAGFTDTVQYTLTDNDGDTANNALNIVVSTQDHKPIVRDDVVITNVEDQNGADQVVIPAWALLYNDSDAEGDTIPLTIVTKGSGGTVGLAWGNVPSTENTTPKDGGTFSYPATANGLTDTGSVTVDRDQNGENTLD